MQFNTEIFAAALALIGVVIIVAALISGLIERSNLPQVAVFLALGAILGPPGLGLLNVDLQSPLLRIVATLSLTLVLFTDALNLSITELKKHWRLGVRVLGPGTLISGTFISLMGLWLLDLPLPAAIILGAALASTDPVLLRGLLRSRELPSAARQALRLESGLNDVVLLPVVLIGMALLASASGHSEEINPASFTLNLFLLGPGAGVAIGLLGVAILDLVRRRIGVRRDYESLYSLGLAFAAFAAAEALHGSGFLAAFTAGLTIAVLDVELCDCFLEYGETTAELALLFTFVLFGSSLIWTGFDVLSVNSLVFAMLALFIRPFAFFVSLAGTRLPRRDRLIISWFGPRGLSSLLLILLPVFAGLPGSDQLFRLCALVVLISVVLHGGSLMLLGRSLKAERHKGGHGLPAASDGHGAAIGHAKQPAHTAPAAPAQVAERLNGDEERAPAHGEYISTGELKALMESGARVVVVDARTERTYEQSNLDAVDAVRIVPLDPAREAERVGLPRDALIAVFCA